MGTVLLTVLAVVIGVMGHKAAAKKQALAKAGTEAEEICAEHGLRDVEVELSYYMTYKDYAVYHLSVSGSGAYQLSYDERYELIEQLDGIWIDYKNTLLLADMVFDGQKYELDVLDHQKLTIDGETVYIYVSDAEKARLERLADILPYEGLEEKYISKTVLGPPSEVIKSTSFEQMYGSRYKKYKWYSGTGRLLTQAFVYYWDPSTNHEVDGYIKTFDYFEGGISEKDIQRDVKKKDIEKNDDPYDVYDYDDPDDFYFDHPDDFFDYYDAEDYFYDHVD